jgi:serine/threonine protein phosphatase PrpC
MLSSRRIERAPHLGAFKFLSVARTHVGHVRTTNEDAYLTKPEIGLWAVADGMGGHECGEVASAALVAELDGVQSFKSAYAFRDCAAGAIRRTNASIFSRPTAETMGSTVVAMLVHDGYFACLWAGDSRAYLHRNGSLRRLTRDHSVVQDLVDAGTLSAEEARSHKSANVITRAVGAHAALKLDDACGAIQPGDRFLLCSDGLHGSVSDQLIGDIMRRAPLEWAANALIESALAHGGHDNITAILIAAESA